MIYSLIPRAIYTCFYMFFLVISLPGYLLKMKRRGGMGTGLLDRFGIYKVRAKNEPKQVLYIHAVSVGEVLIALKLIRTWKQAHGGDVVLATTTSTGHATAREAGLKGVRVIYSPLDIPGLPERCLKRFQPRAIVLIEAELWLNFAKAAMKFNIPMVMLNARLSERSEKRYRRIRPLTRSLFSALSAIGVQDAVDAQRFAGIGVDPRIITITGSIKFDQEGVSRPDINKEFAAILSTLHKGKPVILAASTHDGEEAFIAKAIKKAGGFPLIVPRHAERRQDVFKALDEDGWQCILRTSGILPTIVTEHACYIADTTGELREWTALADIAIIGKSFLAHGGQNPAEAITCSVPVITGPYMENFATLMDLLHSVDGITQCLPEELADILTRMIANPLDAKSQAQRAQIALRAHAGATIKSCRLVDSIISKKSIPSLEKNELI